MMNTYHNTKLEPSSFLGCSKSRTFRFRFRGLRSLSHNLWGQKVAHVSLKTCLISVQSLSPVATVVREVHCAKKCLREKEQTEKKNMQQEENIYALFHRHRYNLHIPSYHTDVSFTPSSTDGTSDRLVGDLLYTVHINRK